MGKVLCIDRSGCTDCESCLSLCPSVFRKNEETGIIEVKDLSDYPEEEVRQVMSMCPAHCIFWEDS